MKLKLKFKFYCLVLCLLGISATTTPTFATPDVWDVLRSQFSLNHEPTQPEVQQQIRWIVAHPAYLQKMARQSQPYIYHVVTEIKKRQLPGELALIPMIESSYDPFSYSGAGAAGLWQLMPGTGTDLGLKQDWWYDGRRSIGPSTHAALTYLAYLHHFFNGDWLLAFAAYDSGEGTMSRSIKNSSSTSGKISFWALKVPQETRAYIPRLLAIAEVIQNPQRYHIELPPIPHTPYFEEVNIGSQIDLNHAAKLAGISYKEMIKLNPGFNHWATAPYRPYKLLIPADKVDDFSRNLANVPDEDRVSWTRHKVSVGDNLVLIARKYHTTVNLIKELNQLKSNAVKKGQFVLIPSSKNTASNTNIKPSIATNVAMNTATNTATNTASNTATNTAKKPLPPQFKAANHYKVIHIVQKNESYHDLQKKYRVAPHDIQSWNHLKPNTPLKAGQQLVLWKHNGPTGTYIVKSGDTLSAIAKRYDIKTNTLLAANPYFKQHPLRPGQKIRLEG